MSMHLTFIENCIARALIKDKYLLEYFEQENDVTLEKIWYIRVYNLETKKFSIECNVSDIANIDHYWLEAINKYRNL